MIFYTASCWTQLYPDGKLANANAAPSSDWVLTGAVEYGRGYLSGRVVRRYSLEDVLQGRVPWFFKNGKQRCHPTDIDHGHHRVWMSPPLVSVLR